ncbi:MAG: hypothetical protein OEY06_09715 [Gammaproteobacteria bacterium]|nr:hypothetical protein [Gammaproteobacteria bacterium]
MKYLPLLLLLLVVPAQAEDNAPPLDTPACLELIRNYWISYEANGVEPVHLFDQFSAQCKSTKELDALILSDKEINDITDRLN